MMIPRWRIEQSEIAQLDEQRQDGGGGREQQAEHQEAHQEAPAEEADVREREGCHRGEQDRQHHRRQRDDQRVPQRRERMSSPPRMSTKLVGIPALRQAERADPEFAHLFEAADDRRVERDQRKQRDEDQASTTGTAETLGAAALAARAWRSRFGLARKQRAPVDDGEADAHDEQDDADGAAEPVSRAAGRRTGRGR